MKSKTITGVELVRRILFTGFAVIVGYLLIHSVFSTCYIGGIEYITDPGTGAVGVNTEHTFFVKDGYLLHLCVFLVCSILLCYRKKFSFVRWGRKGNIALLVLLALGMVYIVLSGGYYPKYDQRTVMELAAALREGDGSSFEVGGYLFKYPHQMGTVLYFQILSAVFGNLNYIAFELVNILFILGTYVLLVKIGGEIWREKEENTGGGILLVCLLFWPYLFYASYLYGTVTGLFFALLSFYMMLLYEKRLGLIQLLLGGVAMAVAVVIKTNYLIFLIAEVLYLVLSGCCAVKKDRKKILALVIFIAVLFGFLALSKAGINSYTRYVNGKEKVEGIPMATYIAMGLQDGKSAPGWYNGYNNTVYEENGFDAEKTLEAAKEEIRKIISGYPQNLSASISFFVKKIASQWNNPTFQSLWLLEEREGRDGLLWLMEGKGRVIYIFLVNLFQTWILAGAFLYSILDMKKGGLKETLLALTFMGGFGFHLFWEAKAMYTIPFFLLLIPLCVRGYGKWGEYLAGKRETLRADGAASPAGKRIIRRAAVILAVIVVICGVSNMDAFAKLFARNDDTEVFNVYTQEIVKQYEVDGE